jgi:hypothetical protein
MTRFATPLAAFILAAAIFILDGWTPAGFAHGLLYVFPVMLLRHQPAAIQAAMAILAAAMIVAGYLTSPAGSLDAYTLLNRSLPVFVVAVIAILQLRVRAGGLRSGAP